jgi:hypothetical protein
MGEAKEPLVINFGEWAGKPSDKPNKESQRILQSMITRVLSELYLHGLFGGKYGVQLDAKSMIRGRDFQVIRRSGSTNRPSVFLRVFLEGGETIVARIIRRGGTATADLKNFDQAWQSWLGKKPNAVRFRNDGYTLLSEPAPKKEHPPVEKVTAAKSTDVDVSETEAANVGGAPRSQGDNAAAQVANTTGTEKLGKFFCDCTNQMLILGQMIVLAVSRKSLSVGFDEWLQALQDDWGNVHNINKFAVISAIITPARKAELIGRWRTLGGNTAYAPTKKALDLLAREDTYREAVRNYVALLKVCVFTSDEIDLVQSNSEMHGTLVYTAASHALHQLLGTAVRNMRQEVAEFHVTEATFLAKIERVRAELKALEDQLTEIRNSAVQEVEIEEVKSSLNRLEEVEKEYQGLVAPSP